MVLNWKNIGMIEKFEVSIEFFLKYVIMSWLLDMLGGLKMLKIIDFY